MDILSEIEMMDKKRGISGSTVKIIALAAMLIDHIAAILLENYLISKGLLGMNNAQEITDFMAQYGTIYYINFFMRCMGRIGFPLFVFLLIEGFLHTKNIRKYAFNLGLFALISEIPFNLAFIKNPWDLSYQNVFFTLFIGLIVLVGFRYAEVKYTENKWLASLIRVGILAIGMLAAYLLKSDYDAMGVATVAVMYILRRKKLVQAASGCAVLSFMSLIELPAFFSLIPIGLYNGERGLKLKYFFYAFYPLHILILYFIAVMMKIV